MLQIVIFNHIYGSDSKFKAWQILRLLKGSRNNRTYLGMWSVHCAFRGSVLSEFGAECEVNKRWKNETPVGNLREGLYLVEKELKAHSILLWASPVALVVKNLPTIETDARDARLPPGSGRFPRVGNSNSLQYSCGENFMGRGAWQATDGGVTKSQTWLATEHTHTPPFYKGREVLQIKIRLERVSVKLSFTWLFLHKSRYSFPELSQSKSLSYHIAGTEESGAQKAE